jgi:hypothetical protein
MSKNIIVRKHSGEQQPFSSEKLLTSILRAGATEEIAYQVVHQIQHELYDGITTREIYKKAFQLLQRMIRSLAARYSIKSAIMELGPSGYPFERFIGEIFRKQGYSVRTGQIVQGRCIQHEMDVIAEYRNRTIMAECKYGNDQSKISSVQVALYVHSRMQDIESRWREEPENQNKTFQGWIFTNTRFSTDAENYGTCAGLHLVSWSFPEKNNLRNLVEKYALFPVTALTGLSRKQKEVLLTENIILAEHLLDKPEALKGFGLSDKKVAEILAEATTLAAIGKIC